MAFFSDLTLYQYLDSDESHELPLLNIGWLSNSKPYPKGETSDEFQEKLLTFCFFEHTVNNCLGYHTCPFCKSPQTPMIIQRGNRRAYLGNGEIRVAGKSAVYAAPTLVYHYVIAHRYRPPDEFIDAVLDEKPLE